MRFSFLDRFKPVASESPVSGAKKQKNITKKPSQHKLWEEPLWDYAVKVYAHDEIERICLSLQDEYHANIDIILWCCWLDAEQIKLSSETLDDVLISIDTVNQSTLLKLRSARRHVKKAGIFTKQQSRVINKQLLNAELMIEKVLLFRLQDFTRRFAPFMQDGHSPLDLHYYFEFLEVESGQDIADKVLGICRTSAISMEQS